MDVVVLVRIPGLQGEHGGVGRRIEFNHCLHGQRPVDEVRGLIVHIRDEKDNTLVVGVCKNVMELGIWRDEEQDCNIIVPSFGGLNSEN